MSGVLSHLRVLDLTRILAGPWTGQVLADMGAEVIKIERPGRGDDTRAWGPPFVKDVNGEDTTEAAYYMSANRGKKSITVDITSGQGQEIIRGLAAKSDVFLENYKVGGLKKYELDYASLKDLNPGLIYCSITGFGQTGPYASRAGYDFIVQGMSGLMSVTGEMDAKPGGGPQKIGVALSDILTGMYACTAILGALEHRNRTTIGQHIDLALLDTQIACMANQGMNYLASGVPPKRLGNAHPNIVPYQTFTTSDGFIIIAVGNDQQFKRLCKLGNQPELADDQRFATNTARVVNREALIPILGEFIKTKSLDRWLEDLNNQGIPCGPINTMDRVFGDPHVQSRDMKIDLPHTSADKVSLIGNPIKYSATPIEYSHAPPLLGEHTESVLKETLNFGDADIKEMTQNGII